MGDAKCMHSPQIGSHSDFDELLRVPVGPQATPPGRTAQHIHPSGLIKPVGQPDRDWHAPVFLTLIGIQTLELQKIYPPINASRNLPPSILDDPRIPRPRKAQRR